MAKKQTICLSMIVKNEAAVIRRCLESVKPFVDKYIIVDTGSTDGTQRIAAEVLSGKTGAVLNEAPPKRKWYQRAKPFDFAKHRNISLEAARKSGCDYVLFIDADEELTLVDGATGTFPPLTFDRYVANFRQMQSGRLWHRSLLIKSSVGWYWKWPIHEVLHCDHETQAAIIQGVEVKSYSDGARNKDMRAKYLRDASACKAAIRAEPNEVRHWFYLAQSYAGALEFRKAFDAYEKRVELGGGWDEELWYAKTQLACLQHLMGAHWRDVFALHMKAFNSRPWRSEPLVMAGVLCRDNGEPATAEILLRAACSIPFPEQDSFLINESIYAWSAADELAGCLAILGRKEECISVLKRVLEVPVVPDEDKKRIADNIAIAEKVAA
jgi:tetratricopeptide (TPR) repeat protein